MERALDSPPCKGGGDRRSGKVAWKHWLRPHLESSPWPAGRAPIPSKGWRPWTPRGNPRGVFSGRLRTPRCAGGCRRVRSARLFLPETLGAADLGGARTAWALRVAAVGDLLPPLRAAMDEGGGVTAAVTFGQNDTVSSEEHSPFSPDTAPFCHSIRGGGGRTTLIRGRLSCRSPYKTAPRTPTGVACRSIRRCLRMRSRV